MMRNLFAAATVAITTTALSPVVQAEDFRIATTIYDLSIEQDSGKPKAVLTTLSLFHHRKVYDYISRDGEVVIFDAATNKFTILNTARSLATTVEFDEIKHLLKVGRMETEKYVGQQQQLGTTTANQVAEALTFQLAPTFETSLDQSTSTLVLKSPNLSYKAICSPKESPAAIKRYVEYTNWMARMNYLLHPQAMFPQARLELNKSLAERQLFPTTIELRTKIEREVALRAKHSVSWELLAHDRSLMTRWEALLKSDDVRRIPFRQYQEAVLVTAAK